MNCMNAVLFSDDSINRVCSAGDMTLPVSLTEQLDTDLFDLAA
jgi:hypothetical protein